MTGLQISNSGLKLREVTAQDHELLAAWIAADPDHRQFTTVEFFATQAPGQECYVLEDEQGPVFFLKLTRAARLDIQFAPGQDSETRARTREGLIAGFAWLGGALESRSFRQVIFNSRSEMLMRSMEKRLGFLRSPGEMVRTLFSERG